VETDRAGLVAGYVGQTALKVQELLKEANGGVLFIDEAYALATSEQSSADFGHEAIAALVKGMEDQRETMAVIASGYKAQMDTFIESNPGLRSRFQTFIDFPNYSPNEMVQIFELLGSQHAIETKTVVPSLHEHFENINTGGSLGNGRYVRALFENMYANLAMRAAADGSVEIHELSEFVEADLPDLKAATAERRRIGFI
jgi:SpoVK/Ycf46/Vps4 family AAA+-type ATPase